MKWTKGRLFDKETIEYFVPRVLRDVVIEDSDWEMFFAKSERGEEPKEITKGYEAIVEGKRWRGIHMEMFEEGILEGTMPYFTILGGEDDSIPRPVVDFMKREMFKGIDAELIESVYQHCKH